MSEYVEGAISDILGGKDATSKNSKLSSLFSKPNRLELKKILPEKKRETSDRDESNTVDIKNVKRPRRDRMLKKKRDPNKEKRTIFVGNLPKDADKKVNQRGSYNLPRIF